MNRAASHAAQKGAVRDETPTGRRGQECGFTLSKTSGGYCKGTLGLASVCQARDLTRADQVMPDRLV